MITFSQYFFQLFTSISHAGITRNATIKINGSCLKESVARLFAVAITVNPLSVNSAIK